MTVNFQNFVDSLGYMGTGMLGIFIVIGIIVGSTMLLNKIISSKKDWFFTSLFKKAETDDSVSAFCL